MDNLAVRYEEEKQMGRLAVVGGEVYAFLGKAYYDFLLLFTTSLEAWRR